MGYGYPNAGHAHDLHCRCGSGISTVISRKSAVKNLAYRLDLSRRYLLATTHFHPKYRDI